MMEAELVPELSMMLRELAPFCLDPEPLPGTPTQQASRAPRCFRPSGRSFWPAHQDSVTALHFLPETERLAQPPAGDTQALGPCWELKDLGALGPAPLARDARAMLTPVNQQHSLGPQGTHSAPSAPPQKRPRKQLNPHRGAEKVDPRFEGVTLKFQIKPDSNLQIMSSYSLTFSSRSQGPPTGPTGGPEANPGGSEILGPRRCASCRTQRTPLWRDAEDGTPLCNACGIRFAEWRKSWGGVPNHLAWGIWKGKYPPLGKVVFLWWFLYPWCILNVGFLYSHSRYKKYGTRCSSCWLVPRKNVQPKRLCGRCGVSLGPHQGPTQEGVPRWKTQASGPGACLRGSLAPSLAPAPIRLG
ncbi:GATA-type zinc finger protein 1 isoform 4-T4 [Hipposideros larvatus]